MNRPQQLCLLVQLLGTVFVGLFANSALAAGPSWKKAAKEAEELIAKSRRLGGEVHAQKAREILSPWWDLEQVPRKIRLQRATLLQRDHHFKEALVDLNQLLLADPRMTEAWLMKTTILTVAGRYEEARKAAVPLFGLASPLLATTAGTAPTSCHGNLAESFQVLSNSLKNHPEEAGTVRCWAHTALAEMAVRMGSPEVADRHFRSALIIDSSSPYLLKNYAYFLLDLDAPERAREWIEKHRGDFPVVWMMIQKALKADDPTLKSLMSEYEASLKKKHAEHGHSHGRDEAIYQLHLKGNVREAIHQALGNWESQREAADLLILFEAATAADDEVSLADALRWVKERGFEDVRLAPYLKESAAE